MLSVFIFLPHFNFHGDTFPHFQYVPDITWIRERGSYYYQEISDSMKIAVYGILIVRIRSGHAILRVLNI